MVLCHGWYNTHSIDLLTEYHYSSIMLRILFLCGRVPRSGQTQVLKSLVVDSSVMFYINDKGNHGSSMCLYIVKVCSAISTATSRHLIYWSDIMTTHINKQVESSSDANCFYSVVILKCCATGTGHNTD